MEGCGWLQVGAVGDGRRRGCESKQKLATEKKKLDPMFSAQEYVKSAQEYTRGLFQTYPLQGQLCGY